MYKRCNERWVVSSLPCLVSSIGVKIDIHEIRFTNLSLGIFNFYNISFKILILFKIFVKRICSWSWLLIFVINFFVAYVRDPFKRKIMHLTRIPFVFRCLLFWVTLPRNYFDCYNFVFLWFNKRIKLQILVHLSADCKVWRSKYICSIWW